jgi:hypothetical protein
MGYRQRHNQIHYWAQVNVPLKECGANTKDTSTDPDTEGPIEEPIEEPEEDTDPECPSPRPGNLPSLIYSSLDSISIHSPTI